LSGYTDTQAASYSVSISPALATLWELSVLDCGRFPQCEDKLRWKYKNWRRTGPKNWKRKKRNGKNKWKKCRETGEDHYNCMKKRKITGGRETRKYTAETKSYSTLKSC
jgi:hypothetical protein